MENLRQFSGSQKRTYALLSIKPEYARSIILGDKRYEFRRTIFNRQVDVVLVYITTPIKRVVAEFDVLSIISEPLSSLWEKTRKYAGINKTVFNNYFKGLKEGHAIEIGNVRLYNEPFCPQKELGLRPPQSFAYITSNNVC